MTAADPLRKVFPGQRIELSAAAVNAWNDAAKFVRNRETSQDVDKRRMVRRADIVRVQNNSGEPREEFSVLGVNGPLATPDQNLDTFKGEVLLEGVTPSAEVHAGRFAVLLEPLDVDAIGLAVIAGVVPVKVKLEGHPFDDEDGDRFADVLDGDATRLRSGIQGSAQILWMDHPDEAEGGDDDTYWAIVRLANDQPIVRKAEMTGTLTQGDTSPAVAKLMQYSEGIGDWVVSSETIEVYAGPGFRGVAFGRTTAVDAGDEVDVYYSPESRQWHAIAGNTYCDGQATEEIAEGGTGSVRITTLGSIRHDGPDADPRQITIQAHNPYWTVDEHQAVSVAWDDVHRRWQIVDGRFWRPGCGLQLHRRPVSEGSPEVTILDVRPAAIAGAGLAVEEGEDGECDKLTIDVSDSCGLAIDEDGALVIVPEDLAGPGLQESGTCGLAIDPGCGIKIDTLDRVAVDNIALAGAGLTPQSSCALAVDVGCGLAYGAEGEITVDPADLAGTALGVDVDEEGECKIGVIYGCGLEIGEFDELKVDAAQLVGRGLEHEGDELGLCKLAIKPGCGIQLNDEDDSVEVKPADLAGKGLVADEETCEIHVDDTPDEGNEQVLTVLAGATLALAGCDLKLTRTTRAVKLLHNADGLLIGVELGEPANADSTVDIAGCSGGGGDFIVGTLAANLSSGGSTTAGGETVHGTFLSAGEELESGTLVGACLEGATGKYHVVVAQGCDESGGGVTDHGELTGREDDDHEHYSLADGTRWSDTQTPDRVAISEANGYLVASTITTSELAALENIDGNIEDRLDALEGGGVGGFTADRLMVSDGSGDLAASSVTATEAGYLAGVTSGIQGQLDDISGDLSGLTSDVSGKVTAAGASGGQTIAGGTAAGEALILKGTTHGTPGPVQIPNAIEFPQHTVTTSTTLTAAHHTLFVNNTAAVVVAPGAAPASCPGRPYKIQKISSDPDIVEVKDDDGNLLTTLYIEGDWVELISDGTTWRVIGGYLTPHSASVYMTTPVSCASTTFTRMPFDAAAFDVGGLADMTTDNRIEIKRAGKYDIKAVFRLVEPTEIQVAQCHVYKNGTTAVPSNLFQPAVFSGLYSVRVQLVGVLDLAAGDYLDLYGQQINSLANSYNTLTSVEGRPTLTVTEVR